MKKKDIGIIIIVNLIISFGLGAIREWGSSFTYYSTISILGIIILAYIVYFYRHQNKISTKKTDTIK